MLYLKEMIGFGVAMSISLIVIAQIAPVYLDVIDNINHNQVNEEVTTIKAHSMFEAAMLDDCMLSKFSAAGVAEKRGLSMLNETAIQSNASDHVSYELTLASNEFGEPCDQANSCKFLMVSINGVESESLDTLSKKLSANSASVYKNTNGLDVVFFMN